MEIIFYKVLNENDIDKILVVNKNVAQIFIKEEALKKAKYVKEINSAFYRKGASIYEYNFGDLQNFENSLNLIKSQNDIPTTVVYETDNNVMSEILISLLPFVGAGHARDIL